MYNGSIVIRKDKNMSKILVVEDEAVLQKALADMLGEAEFEVVQAVDGEQAVEMAKSEQPNLILLDLVLPKKHGLEVLQAIKSDDSTKSIPVIVLTNLEDKDDISRALELGARTYLVKANYDMKEVIAKVQEALAHAG